MAVHLVSAAFGTRNLIKDIKAVKDPQGRTAKHAAWMLDEVISKKIDGEKAQRWLGYAQGILVLKGKSTMEELRDINIDAFIDDTQVQLQEDISRLLITIASTHRELAELRKLCTHNSGAGIGLWTDRGDGTDATERLICDTCRMPIDDYWGQDDPFNVNEGC